MSAYKNAARGGDTNFRKKWDKEEYTKLAEERERREKTELKARYEAKITGKKYKAEEEDVKVVLKPVQARKAQDFSDVINKSYLVPSGASGGRSRKGKGAGFYCEACDETYKDNNSWIDHINSKQHLRKTGQTIDVEQATLQECIDHLEQLKRQKKIKLEKREYDIDQALDDRASQAREERAAKKQKKRDDRAVKVEELDPEIQQEQDDMAQLMGFGGFGTTKV